MISTLFKSKSCCFLGHNIVDKKKWIDVYCHTKVLIQELYEQGYRLFFTCGGLGYDTLAALAIINSKKQLPDIKLLLILPSKNQAMLWSKKQISTYKRIKSYAYDVFYTCDFYLKGSSQRKRLCLSEYCSCCISYQYKKQGVLSNEINYLRNHGAQIFNVYEKLNSVKN